VPSPFDPGFVKICGVTTVEDAEFSARAGASAIGVNLAVGSPRRVSLEMARELISATDGALWRCAIYRGSGDDEILRDLDELDVEMVQLHDALSGTLLDALRERSLIVVKALNIEGLDFDEFDEARVDAVLVDGPRPGSGVTHAWTRLKDRRFAVPVIAAGGLNPANVAAVIESTTIIGVDSASGVERSPGTKDHEAVTSFVTNARRAFASREE
jgi:phosphoribosylanthranilate isomerase